MMRALSFSTSFSIRCCEKDFIVATLARKLPSGVGLIVLAFVAFISLGLPDGLIGVAWPSIQTDFDRPNAALGLLLFFGMLGYITSSFLSGVLMAKLGVGRLLSLSCMLTGLTLIGYTLAPSWELMALLGITSGLGAGAIDAGLNTYIAANYGEGLMQWLHASFGVGITMGPIIMTTGLSLTEQWRVGYWVVGGAQLLLATCFALTIQMWSRPKTTDGEPEPARLTDYKTPLTSTLRERGAWISAALFFIYVGLELTFGHWGYALMTKVRGVEPETAGLWISLYWGAFTVGRILAGLYASRLGIQRLLYISLGLALVGGLMVGLNLSRATDMLGLMVVGFAIAPIFAGLVSDTENRVPHAHAANTIGMQISAAGIGGMAVPSLAGFLADKIGLHIVPWYLVTLCILMIGLFTLSHRLKHTS